MEGRCGLSVAEMSAVVAYERINPEAFNGLAVAMKCVEFAPPLCVPKILPVGSSIASAGEARLFNEGLQKYRTISIACVPVVGQASTHQGEHARSQVTTLDPRQDEEARVVDDQVQVAAALLVSPADGIIARFDFPGARTEAECGDDFTAGANQVPQLCSRQELMAKIVMTLDVGIPEQRVLFLGDQIDTQPRQIDGWDAAWGENGLLDLRMRPISDRFESFGRWQGNEAISLHPQHGDATTHVFEFAVRSSPVQPLADFARKSIATQGGSQREQISNELDLAGFKLTSTILHRSTRVRHS
jgi:hypothetical protein